MSKFPNKNIEIDEEGYLKFDEIRVTDDEVGVELLQNLKPGPNQTWLSSLDGEALFAASFDRPLVALQIEPQDKNWTLFGPYGYQSTFSLDNLRVDDWDRFHGVASNEVQFVMSRAAQAEFFRLMEDYDDDGVYWQGKRYEIPYLYHENTEIKDSAFWGSRYLSEETPWNVGAPHPELGPLLNRIKQARSRVIVPGAGHGHDAALFAEHGHIVTALDFSEAAIKASKRLYSQHSNLKLQQADVFKLPASMSESYDVVFEHTLFCAIPPEKRRELVKVWSRLLQAKGLLIGVLPLHSALTGPPYGATEWEIRELLKKHFRILQWQRAKHSPEGWEKAELIVIAQKK